MSGAVRGRVLPTDSTRISYVGSDGRITTTALRPLADLGPMPRGEGCYRFVNWALHLGADVDFGPRRKRKDTA